MRTSKRRHLARLAIAAAALATTHGRVSAATSPFGTEIIVRTVRNLRNPAETAGFMGLAARHHVTVVNVAAKQDEDDELPSGTTFYASAIAPRAPGYQTFDALHSAIEEAHRHGIKVRAWVPQFHDQMAGRENPDWRMKVHPTPRGNPPGGDHGEFFVNPLSVGVQAYERSIIEEIVRNYDVDGIVLDWLRFDDYNMDLGAETRTRFKESFGYDPVVIDFATDNARRREWNGWRTAQIANYVASVRRMIDGIKPGLALGVYVLPPEFVEVGQDAGQFSQHVSFLAPMLYFTDWGYPLSWVHTNVLPQTKEKAKGTPVIPTLDTDWSDAAYEEIFAHMRRQFPEMSTVSWFVYGAWTEIILERIDRLRSTGR
jgi:hypothetical protein